MQQNTHTQLLYQTYYVMICYLTDHILALTPNQQCQSTEGNISTTLGFWLKKPSFPEFITGWPQSANREPMEIIGFYRLDALPVTTQHCQWHHKPHTTTVLRPFFRDQPGEPVPEENFWTLWCKGRLTEADTLNIRLGATPSGLTSAHVHHPPIFLQAGCPSCRQTNSITLWVTMLLKGMKRTNVKPDNNR